MRSAFLFFIFILTPCLLASVRIYSIQNIDTLSELSPLVQAIDHDDANAVNAWIKLGHSPVSKMSNPQKEKLIDRAISHNAIRSFEVLLRAIHRMHLESKLTDSRGTPILVSLSSLAVPGKFKTPFYEQMISLVLLLNPETLQAKDHAYIGDGRTALHEAAALGNVKLLELLLSHGALINEKNSSGETALHFAARFGHLDAVKYLVSSGALVNEKSRFTKSTPLMAAAETGQEKIIRFLMFSGAERDARDIFGKTAPERFHEYRVASNAPLIKRK